MARGMVPMVIDSLKGQREDKDEGFRKDGSLSWIRGKEALELVT